jgi:hypothetical protein
LTRFVLLRKGVCRCNASYRQIVLEVGIVRRVPGLRLGSTKFPLREDDPCCHRILLLPVLLLKRVWNPKKKKKRSPSSSSSSFSWMRNPKEKKCPADSSPHASRGIKCGVSDLQREGLRHIPVLMLVDLSFHTAFGHNLSVRAVRTGRDQNCYLPLRAPISRPKRTVSILVDVRRHRRIE